MISRDPPSSATAPVLPSRAGPRTAVQNVIFGKRLRSTESEFSFHRERLRMVGAEINLLFAYRVESHSCFAELVDEDEPALTLGAAIGLSLRLQIDPGSGCFVLLEESGKDDCALITASEERLLDQIVSLVCRAKGDLAPRTADTAVDLLVGKTAADVEARLILRTFLHVRGDRRQAALVLGMDDAILRVKLRRLLRSGAGPEFSGQGQ